MSVRRLIIMACAAGLAPLSGCASRTVRVTTPAKLPPAPALTATLGQLRARYESQAEEVRSLSAAVRLQAETGSAFSGVIKDYHRITAFIVAERPASLRMVGQAPVVGTDIFDMVSDGKMFHMYVPSKKRFLVGPASGGPAGKNAIENLRPQPLLEALLWRKIPEDAPVLIEQESREQPPSRDYVLTVLRRDNGQVEIDRRVWFDRSDLRVARIEIFGPGGRLDSDIHYGDWRRTAGGRTFPWRIVLWRPRDDYKLAIDVTQITLNPSIPPDRFTLAQPPGTERVEVGHGVGHGVGHAGGRP